MIENEDKDKDKNAQALATTLIVFIVVIFGITSFALVTVFLTMADALSKI